MTATAAEIGFGVLLKMLTATGPDVYTILGNQRDVSGAGGFSVDTVDATHNASPETTEEVIAGIVRTKEITLEIEYNPVSATTALIEGAKRLLKTFRQVWPDGRYIQFDGYITDFEAESPTEDKQMAAITIKRSGPGVAEAASTPSNLVLPAISGLLSVAATLTAYEGVWANEPTSFTYVWENAGTPIGGATSRTYVVAGGDTGDDITVVVTAINSAGNASAESAAVTIA